MYPHILERRIGADLALINTRNETLCIVDENGVEIWELLKQAGDIDQLKKLVELPSSEQQSFYEFCDSLHSFINNEKTANLGVSLHQYYFEQGVPLVVGVEINTSCPLKCRHCYNVLRSPEVLRNEQVPPPQLSVADVKCLAADLKTMGTPFVIVTGGEPLEHPQFLEICNILSSSGIALKVFTNGWYMTSEIAHALKQMNVSLVGFTLFGHNSHLHEYISDMPGSFDRIVNAIKLVKAEGITTDVTFFLMKHNFTYRATMGAWAQKELGITPAFSFSMTPRENGEHLPFNLEITPPEIETFFRELGAAREALQCGDEKMVPCTAGKTLIAIKANGDVVPCVSLIHPVGNIHTSSFQDIWNNSRELSEFRDLKLENISGCSTCSYSSVCLRCFVNAQFLGHDVFGKDPHACVVSRTFSHVQQQIRKEVK